jgi:hypothetical protein
MNLEKILAENMLRFGVKNLNESATTKLINEIHFNKFLDYYQDSTYFNSHNELVYDTLTLSEQQTKLRALMARGRRAVQKIPFMVSWQQWRVNRFIKKKGLPTQQQLQANDSPEVQNQPGYAEVMRLMYSKKTMDPATIMYWNGTPALGGDGDVNDKQNMGQLITQLDRLNGVTFTQNYADEPAGTVTVDLSGFIGTLKQLYDQGVFLSQDDLLEIFKLDSSRSLNALFSVALTGQFEGIQYNLDQQGAEQFQRGFAKTTGLDFVYNLQEDLKLLNNFSSKLKLAAGGQQQKGKKAGIESIATYEISLSDQDKITICNGVLTKLETDRVESPQLQMDDYTDFYIAPNELTIKSNIVKTTTKVDNVTVEATAVYYSYPDNPNDRTQANVIFGNADDKVTWENTAPFAAAVKARVDATLADGNKIYRVEYNAGARSSKVGTTKYGKPGQVLSDAQKTAGNIALCTARANGIVEGMGPLLKQLMPDGTVLQATTPNLHPNLGPGWYEYDTSEGGYGPLYEAYRKKAPRDTPREFYIARNDEKALYHINNAGGTKLTTAQVNAEYELVYSPFRGTYAGYVIYYYKDTKKTPEPEKELDVDILKAGTWSWALEYNVITTRDIISSTGDAIRSRYKKIKRGIKRIDLGKIKLQNLGGMGENLIKICDAYGKYTPS